MNFQSQTRRSVYIVCFHSLLYLRSADFSTKKRRSANCRVSDAKSCFRCEQGKANGTEITVHAKKVILATGGFGGSDEIMNQYLVEDWKLYGMAQLERTAWVSSLQTRKGTQTMAERVIHVNPRLMLVQLVCQIKEPNKPER